VQDGRQAGTARAFFVVGTVLTVLYTALPRSVATQGVFVALACAPPIAGLVARSSTRDRSGGWRALLIGSTIVAVGELADLIWVAWHPSRDAGAAIDLVFLIAYAAQLFGLMALLRAESATRHRFGWFDASAVSVAVAALVWATMYDTIFRHRHASVIDVVTRFGGATLGVGLVVMSMRLTSTSRRPSHRLLLAAFAAQFGLDCVAALWGGYRPGGRLDAVWAIGYVLIGTAYMVGPMSAPATEPPTEIAAQEIKHTLVLQAGVMAVLGALIFLEGAAVVPVVTLVVCAVAWISIQALTRVRVFGLLRLVGEASATENQQRLGAMVETSRDIIGLADPDGRIRYLSPALGTLTGTNDATWLGRRFDEALSATFAGLDSLPGRVVTMKAGDVATWECTRNSPDGTPTHTFQLSIAHRLDVPEVRGWVISAHDVTTQARLTAELRHQSLHDLLTGLPNRALLFDRVEQRLGRTRRTSGSTLSVVLIDLDDFKTVNDTYGPAFGDDLLREIAQRLAAVVGPDDTLARLGADEFALLLDDADESDATDVARRALDRVAAPFGRIAVTASAGICVVRHDVEATDVLRAVDIAMSTSKHGGRSKITVFDPEMHEQAKDVLALRMDLAVALERNQLRVLFQPIVELSTGRVKGAEALVRWYHPERGLVSPAEFIPIAERSGEIIPIGAWVLATACATAAAWGDDVYVSVNVAVPQLSEPGFVELVAQTIESSGIDSRRVMLEITESMLVDDHQSSAQLIASLRALGLRIAIDDFGTGYSSLSYLREFSADVLKIDQSFVRDIDTRSDHQSLTAAIQRLADGLQMSTIAEGVETAAEADMLRSLHAGLVQGYLYSRPVDAGAFAALLAAQREALTSSP
jgi:diguanylate cyclase (GGDEF)-like protein/PAS domain S-box-containing protein